MRKINTDCCSAGTSESMKSPAETPTSDFGSTELLELCKESMTLSTELEAQTQEGGLMGDFSDSMKEILHITDHYKSFLLQEADKLKGDLESHVKGVENQLAEMERKQAEKDRELQVSLRNLPLLLKATFFQSTITQKILKTTSTLSCWYVIFLATSYLKRLTSNALEHALRDHLLRETLLLTN